ncbi:MAG: protein-methionine-sulfoxide reductase catalytic subunit MsrP [Rhodobacteraceae bacterium]|nr:protein-methionine-sulfoxide reductase catalytic subunit MsrP [Paracoccaceae bacterium]
MAEKFKPDLKHSQVTPRHAWLNRRQIMAGATGLLVGSQLSRQAAAAVDLSEYASSVYSTDEEPNKLEDITKYNNFYEFGTDKSDPSRHAASLTTEPWAVEIGGMVGRPGTYDLDEIVDQMTLEERIYRLRCVEAWSMVVPWIGFELSELLNWVEPQPGAKYVAFETVYRPDEMRGQRTGFLDWPYVEGLRMDEAMNPLTILSVGLYGDVLPNQNGAPVRLVVPWKYGFKSIKSIVKITLTDAQPRTTWSEIAPHEYGFYANVNPEVSHPRWSQASERAIGGGLFAPRKPTRMFNGYGEYVAQMYDGMDLAVAY